MNKTKTALASRTAWTVFTEHQKMMAERSAQFEKAKAENSNYLPLLDPLFKQIEGDYAKKQLNTATDILLDKFVYILKGKMHTGACFEGEICVTTVRQCDDIDACVYLLGWLVDEHGDIDAERIVQIRVDKQTYIRYR